MRKRGARFKQREAICPTVVKMSFGDGKDFEIFAYTSINALMGGWADAEHIDHLHDLANTVLLVGHHKKDDNAQAAARAMRGLVKTIVERRRKTGKYGITGDELALLRKFVTFMTDYYRRTSGETLTRAELTVTEVKASARKELQNEQRK